MPGTNRPKSLAPFDPSYPFRDIFWKGDKIVWKNMFINYLRCLDHIYTLAILLNDDKKITENDIPIVGLAYNKSNLKHKKILNQICENFFSNSGINDLPISLENRNNPVRRSELLSHFKFIHQFALNSISEIYYKEGIFTKKKLKNHKQDFIKIIEKSGNLAEITNKLENENQQNVTEIFFQQANMIGSQIELMTKFDYSDKELSSNQFFLLSEFPEHFLSSLESSIYPNWYSASFLPDCTNSAIWGHYGDNHKGVCLKYKVKELDGKCSLDLETEYGYSSGPLIGMRPHLFQKIDYHNKHMEIDFFRSIGRMTKGELYNFWYSDENENISICAEHLNDKNEKWIEKYWDNFKSSILIKLKEWEYEQESRLIVNDFVNGYTEKDKRKMKYDFNDLEGIIFGIKTHTSDKIRILKIIERKCKESNRKDFDFFQAYYSKESGEIETQKLNFLKFD